MNAINWFEVPASDFERAVKFYSNILGTELRTAVFGEMPYGYFPSDGNSVGGAIAKADDYIPTPNGVVIYLNAGTPSNIDTVLARVEAAGGKVVMPKTSIGENGWIGLLLDSEGNKIGLQAPN